MFDNRSYHLKPDNDDPSSHQGRSRLFEHERGNWATYIYIPCESLIIFYFYRITQYYFKV